MGSPALLSGAYLPKNSRADSVLAMLPCVRHTKELASTAEFGEYMAKTWVGRVS